MPSTIEIHNLSTVVTNQDVFIMIQAMIQFLPTFCNAWNIQVPTLTFVPGSLPSNPNNWNFAMTDTSDVDGALAYHSEANDIIDGLIFCQTILQNGGVKFYQDNTTSTIAQALAHEIFEALIDEYCNGWWSDGNGTLWASEVADPVESGVVPVQIHNVLTKTFVTVGLSDFIFPSWLDSQATSTKQFNYLNTVHAPFTIDNGGYAVIETDMGDQQQIYGEMLPDWKKQMKQNKNYRTQRKIKNKKKVPAIHHLQLKPESKPEPKAEPKAEPKPEPKPVKTKPVQNPKNKKKNVQPAIQYIALKFK